MKNELKIGSLLSILSIIIGSLIQILYTPMYMKYLGTSDYGINSLVQSLIGNIGMLNLGLGSAMLRYTVRYRAEGKIEEEESLNGMFLMIFFIIMGISVMVGTILYKNIPKLFIDKFTLEELQKTQKVFLIMLASVAISFPISVFSTNISSRQKFIYQKGIGLIKMLSIPIIGAILMLNNFGLFAVVTSTVILNLLAFGFDIIYSFKLGMRLRFQNFNFKILKEISLYSFYIFLNIVVDRIFWGIDGIIIGKYIGTTAVGIYSIATIFNYVYMQLSTAISGVLFPKINILVVENKYEELSNLFIKIGRLQYILLALISSGFILFGKEFIYLWLGKGYHDVYTIALWIMLPITIPLIQNTGISIMQARNLHQFRSILYMFIAIANLISSIHFVKIYGTVGCAIATGISFIFGHILIMNIYYYKKVNVDILKFWKNIFLMSIPVFLSIILGIVLNRYFVIFRLKTFIIKGILYSLGYFVFMYMLGMNTFEKKEILKLKIFF